MPVIAFTSLAFHSYTANTVSTSITIFILLLLLDHIHQTFRKSCCQRQISHFCDVILTYETDLC